MLHRAGDQSPVGFHRAVRPCALHCLHKSLRHRTQRGTKSDDETKLGVTVDSRKGREAPQRDMDKSEG